MTGEGWGGRVNGFSIQFFSSYVRKPETKQRTKGRRGRDRKEERSIYTNHQRWTQMNMFMFIFIFPPSQSTEVERMSPAVGMGAIHSPG